MTGRNGYFEIDRVDNSISTEQFHEKYFRTETPVIIEGIGNGWPALEKWDWEYLRNRLAAEPSVRNLVKYFKMNREVMAEDIIVPGFVELLNHSPEVFSYRANASIWVNTQGNVSSWHYDNGMINNFNTQIRGSKDWILISPQTPPDYYPYSSYAIPEREGKVLKNKMYARFTQRRGDMLYLPPLWTHQVKARDTVNINLCWRYTKRRTGVISPLLVRDEQRYRMDWYLSRHPIAAVRNSYNRLMRAVPAFLNNRWVYEELIETGMRYHWYDYLVMILKEDLRIPKALLSYPEGRRALSTSDVMPPLAKSRPQDLVATK